MSRSFFWQEQKSWSFLDKDEKTREDEKTFRGQELKIEGPNFEGLSALQLQSKGQTIEKHDRVGQG